MNLNLFEGVKRFIQRLKRFLFCWSNRSKVKKLCTFHELEESDDFYKLNDTDDLIVEKEFRAISSALVFELSKWGVANDRGLGAADFYIDPEGEDASVVSLVSEINDSCVMIAVYKVLQIYKERIIQIDFENVILNMSSNGKVVFQVHDSEYRKGLKNIGI